MTSPLPRSRNILIVAILVLFCTSSTLAQPADIRFENETIPSGNYEATGTISARNATITSTSSVTFRAGQTVRLEAGFKIEAGATLRAEVDSDVGSGGGIVLSNMPSNERAGRFYADRFDVYRPALSLRGFDSEVLPGGSNLGYGLKQVLEKVYVDSDFLVEETYKWIVQTSNLSQEDPLTEPEKSDRRTIINRNTNIAQCRAFIALATYVLEQNGNNNADYQIPLGEGNPAYRIPPHSEALDNLRDALLNPPQGVLFISDGDTYGGDQVQWTRSIGNFARALDLYIALENAYGHFGHPDYANENAQTLLTRTQKRDLLRELYLASDIIHNAPSQFLGKEVEPGNRPMKMYVASGYAALGLQDVPEDNHGGVPDIFLDGAVASLWRRGDSRRLQWGYQSSDGERFWAEGAYYLEFSLLEVLPFWHAMRANGLLTNYDYSGSGIDLADPFNSASDWALNPLRWLADLVTPGGMTVPLDDGNKRPIQDANLLRWAPEYGDAELGQKYAWINERLGGPAGETSRDPSTLLNEIAIPRVASTQAQAPKSDVVNTAPPFVGGEQQLVIRRGNAGPEQAHYLLLNGERGDAIGRGEGHEQGDNMQLLYYVGTNSYLMDSGYDQASFDQNNLTWNRSRWNNYHDHNTMRGYPRWPSPDMLPDPPANLFGGIRPPRLDRDLFRVKSEFQQDTRELYKSTHGNIDVLHARINLESPSLSGQYYYFGDYRRHALFINDPAGPYLIDFNMLINYDENEGGFYQVMSYHGNSDVMSYTPEQDGFALWQGIDETQNNHLFLFPDNVENDLLTEGYHTVRQDFAREDGSGIAKEIKRLNIYATTKTSDGETKIGGNGHTTVAFVKALTNTNPSELANLTANLPQRYDTTPLRPGGFYTAQGWTWTINANTLDFFAARSATSQNGAYSYDVTDIPFKIASAEDFDLLLPETEDYGFVRLVRQNGVWTIADGYQVGLEVPELMAEIDGPHAVAPGQSVTWTAEAYGGSGSYTYRWHVGNSPNNLQDTGATTIDYTHSATADFYLRVDVTSGGETAQSDLRRIYVGRPAPPSDLVLLNPYPGGEDEHPRFAWQASPTPDVTYRLYRCEGSTPGCNVADNPSLPNGEDEDVTIQDNCPNHQQSNTSYHVTAFGTLGESDETNEVDLCGTAPDPSAQAVAGRLEAASGQAVEAMPKEYALEAAYPNPFNPSATIRYALPEAADVRLVVYDVVGREVARLVEGKRAAGYHRVRFDGSRLASGLYLYRLVAKGERETFSKTGRMVLVK